MFTAAAVIGAVAIGGRIYGQHLAHEDMLERDRALHQLETESQKLERQSADQAGAVAVLQTKLTQTQEQLDKLVPSTDTYRIDPNKSVVVGAGQLTLGLVGLPKSDGVTINVNGKQYSAAAGDVIRVADDVPCKVVVQSFDVFNATVTASCSEPKTH